MTTATTDQTGWPRQAPRWLRRSVIFILIALAGFQIATWGFGQLTGFLGLLFLAWLFSISIEPVVEWLHRYVPRRGMATGLVLLGLGLAVVGFVALFGTLLVTQLSQLVQSLPNTVSDAVDWVNRTFGTDLRPRDINDALQLTPKRIQEYGGQLTSGLFGLLSQLVGWIFQALTILLFAFYMSAQQPALRATVSSWFPPRHQRVISTVWKIAVEKAGGYVVSRFVLAALSAFFIGVVLLLLGVPYWLPLAIWTGLVSQFVPTIGTYLAIALPALVAVAKDPLDAVWVVAYATAYQQVENYLFAPRVTARTVSIHPAVAFGSVIAGAALFGPIGALVSIPVVAAIQAVIETYGRRYELAIGDDDTTPLGTRPVEGTSPKQAADGDPAQVDDRGNAPTDRER
ncbi:MAG: AI-2E family transporter [Nocardioidaceae bacterium]